MSDALWPQGLESTRLHCPWDFPKQEYWSGVPLPTPGDLPDPEIEPTSPVSSALAKRFFTTVPPGKLNLHFKNLILATCQGIVAK